MCEHYSQEVELDPGLIVLFSDEAALSRVIEVGGGIVPTPGRGATALDAMKQWFKAIVAQYVNCPMTDLTPEIHTNPLPVCLKHCCLESL